MIIAIDPGTTQSGLVLFDGKVIRAEVMPNEELLSVLSFFSPSENDTLAIEMIASYGMPVGKEVFETCVWIGRFIQVWNGEYKLIYRKDVKMHLCGTPRAKDGNIRQALIDLLGPQGTKKAPGPTYGVKSHTWAALGVAVTALS